MFITRQLWQRKALLRSNALQILRGIGACIRRPHSHLLICLDKQNLIPDRSCTNEGVKCC